MIKTSESAILLLNLLNIKNSENNRERARRFINRLIQDNKLKGKKDGKNYIVDKEQIQELAEKVDMGMETLPTTLYKQYSVPTVHLKEREEESLVMLDKGEIEKLSQIIGLFKEGYTSEVFVNDAINRMIAKKRTY